MSAGPADIIRNNHNKLRANSASCWSYYTDTHKYWVQTLLYWMRINYRTNMQNPILTNTEQKYMMLLPFEKGMFAVSCSNHGVQISIGTRVEPPQNCYIAQIPGQTNYTQLVRQPFPSNTGLRFSREMAVSTIGPFQMLGLLSVIDTNFTIMRHFLLKLRRNEILR
jgi:hypothetical protein